jgi:hypothetical protein
MTSESKGSRCIEVGLRAVVPLWQGGVRAQQRVHLTRLIGAQIQVRTRFVESEVATLGATEPPGS